MIQQYVTNASILLLCIFGYYLAALRFQKRPGVNGPYHHLLTGGFFGIAGILLVFSSVLLENAVRMDLRSIDILIASMLGGPFAALIATVCISVARFFQGGIYYASIVGVASSFFIMLGCIAIVRMLPYLRIKTWVIGYLYTYGIIVITYAMVLKNGDSLLRALLNYTLVSLPTAGLCYLLNTQLTRMNGLYSELHLNEEKYRQLFHSAHDLVFLFSLEDGRPKRYLEVNEAAAAALGYTREELIRRSPEGIYDPVYLKPDLEPGEELEPNGRPHIYEWSLETRDGGFVPVEISGRVFRLQGELVCFAVARDISMRKESERSLLEANRKLEKLSVSDGLTGITNRRGMDLYYRMFWDQAEQHGESIAVLLLDIDFFKAYNDTYGHLAGDQCLKRIAYVLESHAVYDKGLASRYGGEEFAVILPGAGIMEALQAATCIRKAVEALAIPHSGSSVYGFVTVSIGIAVHLPAEGGMEREELLEAADQALYMAKHAGRNRVMAWGDSGPEAAVASEDA